MCKLKHNEAPLPVSDLETERNRGNELKQVQAQISKISENKTTLYTFLHSKGLKSQDQKYNCPFE